MDRLDEIRQRTEAAWPGPWGKVGSSLDQIFENPYNIHFISHSRDDMDYLLSEVDRLTARAEAAEAERDACKADLKSMADWYRDSVCDDGICGWCKQDADHGLDGDANECAGFYKNDCFEWRGPQEAEKGESHETNL